MSKMFETLGPLGLEWCFSKIEDSEKLIYEFRERERERETKNKKYLAKIIMNQPWNHCLLCRKAP